jgi:hypothetical protein
MVLRIPMGLILAFLYTLFLSVYLFFTTEGMEETEEKEEVWYSTYPWDLFLLSYIHGVYFFLAG